MNLKRVSVFALVAVLGAACLAQEDRIRSVNVAGVSGAQADEVYRAVRVRAGDIFSQKAVQDDYLAILKLPFILSASAKKTVTPEGVDITYEIKARDTITAIRFAGNKKLKDKKLVRIGGLEKLLYYDLARFTEAKQLMMDEYKKKGYLFAKVSFATQSDGSVLFTIDEGRRLRVRTVAIIGNKRFSDALLKKEVRTSTRRYLVLPYRLDEGAVEEDMLRLRDFYVNRGYLDASVKVRLDVDKKGTGLTVAYLVGEGDLYKVSEVEIEGNGVISTEKLRARLKMLEGQPFSPMAMRADAAAIEEAYGSIGRIDAQAKPVRIIAADAPRVSVSYRITEGETIYVNEIAIFGNDKTRDNVIRREMQVHPAEKFNIEKLRRSKRNLERLAYFSKVEIPPFEKTDDPLKRNVIVNVEETQTGQLMLGIAASSEEGLTGQIVLSQRNFDYAKPPRSWRDITEGRAWVGGGQTLELSAFPGTEYSRFGVSYRDPRVADSDYSLGLNAQRWKRERETYTEERKNGGASIGKAFGEEAFWEVATTIGTVGVDDIKTFDRNRDGVVGRADVPSYLADVIGSNHVNLLAFTIGHDTRNSLIRPTQGHLVKATVETSAACLGSDFDFLRFLFSGHWYSELARDELDRAHVLSWRGRVGQMVPKSGAEDSPVFERFFVGGPRDVRGFQYRGLGPHDGDEVTGGEFMATGGLQYEFPLHGEIFRGALFWDAGTLFDDPGDFTLDEIRHSVGFGLRFIIPPPLNTPIALDFGFPVAKEGEDDTQVFSFSFGWAM